MISWCTTVVHTVFAPVALVASSEGWRLATDCPIVLMLLVRLEREALHAERVHRIHCVPACSHLCSHHGY